MKVMLPGKMLNIAISAFQFSLHFSVMTTSTIVFLVLIFQVQPYTVVFGKRSIVVCFH